MDLKNKVKVPLIERLDEYREVEPSSCYFMINRKMNIFRFRKKYSQLKSGIWKEEGKKGK